MNYELPETQNRPINLNDNNNNNNVQYVHACGLLETFSLAYFFFTRVPGDVLTAKRIKNRNRVAVVYYNIIYIVLHA